MEVVAVPPPSPPPTYDIRGLTEEEAHALIILLDRGYLHKDTPGGHKLFYRLSCDISNGLRTAGLVTK